MSSSQRGGRPWGSTGAVGLVLALVILGSAPPAVGQSSAEAAGSPAPVSDDEVQADDGEDGSGRAARRPRRVTDDGEEGLPGWIRPFWIETSAGMTLPLGGENADPFDLSFQWTFLRLGYAFEYGGYHYGPELEFGYAFLVPERSGINEQQGLFQFNAGFRLLYNPIRLERLFIEPHLGIGLGNLTRCDPRRKVGCDPVINDTYFAIRAGNQVTYRFWGSLAAGMDLRLEWLPGGRYLSMGILGTFGARFF